MGRRCDYRTSLCPALRRVDGVRITTTERGTTAEVIGVGHRRPITVPVSLALATRLVAQGAPLITRSARPATTRAATAGTGGSDRRAEVAG